MIRSFVFLVALSVAALPASAEVRFGKNVRVGGHDASNQTFDKNNRGKYIIHDKEPKNPGCVIRKNKDGSQTKVCNLKKKN
ncbi:hypothetical protein GGR95_000525 [Sulfitobacter undariae]|uniref:Uncharacterized protein n=1 Tax=Sulfitobacter undariae TaxID=1563671 RepID=A0A7W6E3R6_9RHOB|nr:hypothetical protein [Sulfitobacter undariae]MBB3992906.1 hypothetical protein [Sulfitobacter undariae]